MRLKQDTTSHKNQVVLGKATVFSYSIVCQISNKSPCEQQEGTRTWKVAACTSAVATVMSCPLSPGGPASSSR